MYETNEYSSLKQNKIGLPMGMLVCSIQITGIPQEGTAKILIIKKLNLHQNHKGIPMVEDPEDK